MTTPTVNHVWRDALNRWFTGGATAAGSIPVGRHWTRRGAWRIAWDEITRRSVAGTPTVPKDQP